MSPSITGVTIDSSSGLITVATSQTIATTSFTASVTVGSQTATSSPFTIEVFTEAILEDKLLTKPNSTYELQLGQKTEVDLGKYQADSD